MVFLGGAVLANIVSRRSISDDTKVLTWRRWPTKKTCGYQRKSGRSRDHVHWKSWGPDEIEIGMPWSMYFCEPRPYVLPRDNNSCGNVSMESRDKGMIDVQNLQFTIHLKGLSRPFIDQRLPLPDQDNPDCGYGYTKCRLYSPVEH